MIIINRYVPVINYTNRYVQKLERIITQTVHNRIAKELIQRQR